MSVEEVCVQIHKKMLEEAPTDTLGCEEYGIFYPAQHKWLDFKKPLGFYHLQTSENVEFRKKYRMLRVKMLDGALKTVRIDESLTVQELAEFVSSKMGIFSNEYMFANEKQRSKKHPCEDSIEWLDGSKSFPEQMLSEADTVLLRKKFYFCDEQLDQTNVVEVNLMYLLCKESILCGRIPCTQDESITFAALQSQIDGKVNLKEQMVDEHRKKDVEKKVLAEAKKLEKVAELVLKHRYVVLCRGLKTYGITFFLVKEKHGKKEKMVPLLLGVTKEFILRYNPETREQLQSWPLISVKRWMNSSDSLSLDFGDHSQELFSVQTTRGQEISQLIQGYITLIVKKRQELENMSARAYKAPSLPPITLEPISPVVESDLPTYIIRTYDTIEVVIAKLEQRIRQLFKISPIATSDPNAIYICANSLAALFSALLASLVSISRDLNSCDLENMFALMGPIGVRCSMMINSPEKRESVSTYAASAKMFVDAVKSYIKSRKDYDPVLQGPILVSESIVCVLRMINCSHLPEKSIYARIQKSIEFLDSLCHSFLSHLVAKNEPNIESLSIKMLQLKSCLLSVAPFISTPLCRHQAEIAIKRYRAQLENCTKNDFDLACSAHRIEHALQQFEHMMFTGEWSLTLDIRTHCFVALELIQAIDINGDVQKTTLQIDSECKDVVKYLKIFKDSQYGDESSCTAFINSVSNANHHLMQCAKAFKSGIKDESMAKYFKASADSLGNAINKITCEKVDNSDFFSVPMQNLSISACLYELDLETVTKDSATQAAIQTFTEINRRYAIFYQNSTAPNKVIMANQMADVANDVIKCSKVSCSRILQSDEFTKNDLTNCEDSLLELLKGLQNFSDYADRLELLSMIDELTVVQHSLDSFKKSFSMPEYKRISMSVKESNSCCNQIISMVKQSGLAGIYRSFVDLVIDVIKSTGALSDKQLLNDVITKSITLIQNGIDKKPGIEENTRHYAYSTSRLLDAYLAEVAQGQDASPCEKIHRSLGESSHNFLLACFNLLAAKRWHKYQESDFATLESSFKEVLNAFKAFLNLRAADQESISPEEKKQNDEVFELVQSFSRATMDMLKHAKKEPDGPNDNHCDLYDSIIVLDGEIASILTKCSQVNNLGPSEFYISMQILAAALAILIPPFNKEPEKDIRAGFENLNCLTSDILLRAEVARTRDSLLIQEICERILTMTEKTICLSLACSTVEFHPLQQSISECRYHLRNLGMNIDNPKAVSEAVSWIKIVTKAICIQCSKKMQSNELGDHEQERLGLLMNHVDSNFCDLETTNSINAVPPLVSALDSLYKYSMEGSFDMRDKNRQVLKKLRNLVICRDDNETGSYKGCMDEFIMAVKHYQTSLEMSQPQNKQLSVFSESIKLNVMHADQEILKGAIDGLNVSFDHDEDLYQLSKKLLEAAEKFSPSDNESLKQSSVAFKNLSSAIKNCDNGVYEHSKAIGECLIKKDAEGAKKASQNLVSILKMRKTLNSLGSPSNTPTLVTEGTIENAAKHLSELVSPSDGKATFSPEVEKVCAIVEQIRSKVEVAKKKTSNQKLQAKLEKSMMNLSASIFHVQIDSDKKSEYSNAIKNVLSAIQEVNKESTETEAAIKVIEHEIIPEFDKKINQTEETKNNLNRLALKSNCHQLEESLNNISEVLEHENGALFSVAINESVQNLQNLCECIKLENNDTLSDKFKQTVLEQWPIVIRAAQEARSNPESFKETAAQMHRNINELSLLAEKQAKKQIQQKILEQKKDEIQKMVDTIEDGILDGSLKEAEEILNASAKEATDEEVFAAVKDFASHAIKLLHAASRCQAELEEKSPKSASSSSSYHDDGTWKEGFVSAAQLVLSDTMYLFDTIRDYHMDKAPSERIMACAKSIASSTAHVVSAATVKTNTQSAALEDLNTCGKVINSSIESLAKSASRLQSGRKSRVENVKVNKQTSGRTALIEAQTDVLAMEKELEKARTRYTDLQKKRYQ